MLTIQLSEKEFHTLLAALRYYQQRKLGNSLLRIDAIHELATNGGRVRALTAAAIDELCERINTSASA